MTSFERIIHDKSKLETRFDL